MEAMVVIPAMVVVMEDMEDMEAMVAMVVTGVMDIKIWQN